MPKIRERLSWALICLSLLLVMVVVACGGGDEDTSTPTPPTEAPSPTSTVGGALITFGDGTYVVGTDVAPGTYRNSESDPSQGCQWARLSGFGGESSDVITELFSYDQQVVTISPDDAGFTSSGCGTWTLIGASPTPTPVLTTSPTAAITPIAFSLEPFTNLAHGINLLVPKGWIIDESDPDTLTISNTTWLASIEITVNTFASSLTQTQFDEYVSLRILDLEGEFASFEEVSRRRADTSPGFLIRFTFTREGEEAEALALYTFNTIRGALALATTDADFFDLFASLFEEVLNSITVDPFPPGPTPTPAPTPIPTPTPISTVTPGQYVNPTHGFTLQIPSGWGIWEPGKEAAFRIIGPGEIIVQVSVAVVPGEMSDSEYSQILRENRYEPLEGYEVISEGEITLGILAARELQFTAATGPDQSINRWLVFDARRGTQAYIIEAIGPQAAFEQNEAEIRGLITSFRP